MAFNSFLFFQLRLCKEIPQLFVESLHLFLSEQVTSNLDTNKLKLIKYFLKFIPLANDYYCAFFQHIPKQIAYLLHNISFLPVLSDNNTDAIRLRKPYECMVIENYESLADLMPLDSIQKILSRYFIHPYLYNTTKSIEEKCLTIKQLVNLGVKKFDFDDLLCLLNANFNLCQTIDSSQLHSLTRWLRTCEEFSFKLNPTELNKFYAGLKKIKIIPLANSDNGSGKELCTLDSTHVVYFPIFDYDKHNLNRNILKLIENELNLIDLEFLNIDYNSSLIKFTASLGECFYFILWPNN
jgi:hypothetical protein